MSELRNTINQGISEYTQNTPPLSPYRFLWYILTAIVVCIVIVWIIYSVGGENIRTQIHTFIKNSMDNIQKYLSTKTKHKSSESTESADTSSDAPDSSSAPPTNIEETNPIDAHYSKIEQETQAVNTALNYTPPSIEKSNNSFQNDDPDSIIQVARPQDAQGSWWYIDSDNGIPNNSIPLQNVYVPSDNTKKG